MRSTNRSLEFLRRISRRRHSAKSCVESISEYVEQHAALLTPEQLDELRVGLPLLNVRFAAIAVPQFPHLQRQLKLVRVTWPLNCNSQRYEQGVRHQVRVVVFPDPAGTDARTPNWTRPGLLPPRTSLRAVQDTGCGYASSDGRVHPLLL